MSILLTLSDYPSAKQYYTCDEVRRRRESKIDRDYRPLLWKLYRIDKYNWVHVNLRIETLDLCAKARKVILCICLQGFKPDGYIEVKTLPLNAPGLLPIPGDEVEHMSRKVGHHDRADDTYKEVMIEYWVDQQKYKHFYKHARGYILQNMQGNYFERCDIPQLYRSNILHYMSMDKPTEDDIQKVVKKMRKEQLNYVHEHKRLLKAIEDDERLSMEEEDPDF